MNTKMIWGVVALAVVALGAYFAAQQVSPSAALAPLEVFAPASSTTGTSSAPSTGQGTGAASDASAPLGVVQGAPVKVVKHHTLAFDRATFTATTPYPTVSGSGSNVTSAEIVVNDSGGVGLESAILEIKNGRWSYSSTRALTPGTYTLFLGTDLGEDDLIVKATLIVK